jgi:preprotein translocase subunit SecD
MTRLRLTLAIFLLAVILGTSSSCRKQVPRNDDFPAVLPDIQFRLASRDVFADWVETKIAKTEETIFLDPLPVLTSEDIYFVAPNQDEGDHFSLSISVLPESGKRLRKFTKAHIGRLMVVVVNGVPEHSLVIEGEFSDRFLISGYKDVAELYDQITGNVPTLEN